jgi:hypothetical protein
MTKNELYMLIMSARFNLSAYYGIYVKRDEDEERRRYEARAALRGLLLKLDSLAEEEKLGHEVTANYEQLEKEYKEIIKRVTK